MTLIHRRLNRVTLVTYNDSDQDLVVLKKKELQIKKPIKLDLSKRLPLSSNNSLLRSKDHNNELTQGPVLHYSPTSDFEWGNEKQNLLEMYPRTRNMKQRATRIEQLVEHDQRALRRLKTHNWLLGEPKVLQFFEVRHRGIELWKIARNHFQSKSKKSPQEAFEEELRHKGTEISKARKNNWTIHPNSFLKFFIYFLKLLSLIYNFFFIQVM